MYHSISFGTGEADWTGEVNWKNTWDDWHLIPASRPTLALPKATENFVEVPGMDGSYDFSEFLAGRPTFSDRTGSFEFLVDNDHEHWVTIYRNIATFLHGKRMRMILADDDPGYFYEGRFNVASWTPDKTNSKVTINYRVGPYKYTTDPRGTFPGREVNHNDIRWDIFAFEQMDDWYPLTGITVNGNTYTYNLPMYANIDDTTKTIVPTTIDLPNMPIKGFDMPYYLFAKCEATSDYVTVSFANSSITFHIENVGQSFGLGPSIRGNNRLTISGTGTVSFYFMEGSL